MEKKEAIKPIKIINTKVAGVSYKNTDGSSRQAILGRVRSGDTITLVRDPFNQYDKNAIKVMVIGQQVGWIGRHLSGDLAALMDKGHIITGKVTKKTGFENDKWGCNIALYIYEPVKYPRNLDF